MRYPPAGVIPAYGTSAGRHHFPAPCGQAGPHGGAGADPSLTCIFHHVLKNAGYEIKSSRTALVSSSSTFGSHQATLTS